MRLSGGIAVVAMLSATVIASAQDSEPVAVPDPVVNYSFDDLKPDDTTITNSGSGGAQYDGTIGNVGTLQVGEREEGSTAKFPGGPKGSAEKTMPYITIPNGVLKDAQGLTVSAWINWDGNNGNDAKASPWAWYVGGDKLAKNTTGLFLTPSEAGKLTSVSDTHTKTSYRAITGAPDADTWQYVTVTQDASTMTIYVNGEKKSSVPAAQDFAQLHNDSSTFSALIGRTAFTAQYASWFGGQIDDFSIRNVALNEDQAAQLYGDSSGQPENNEPESVEPSAQQITQGQMPTLPQTVRVLYSNGEYVNHTVTWEEHDWTNQGVGEVTLAGVVEGVPENLKATLTINVVAQNTEKVTVSQVKQNGSKGYLEVDGQPFYFSGLQNMSEWQRYGNDYQEAQDSNGSWSGPYMKNNWDDPLLDESWSENLFEKTASAGFKTIQFMFSWKNIEPGEPGVYDWSVIDRYVQWAQKYDLRINFVWFGTNTQGGGVMENTAQNHGFMASVPKWAEEKLPDGSFKYFESRVSGHEKYYTRTPLNESDSHYQDATYLFDMEAKAVRAMFDHLAQVDNTHRVIMFNVWNEPDSAAGFCTFGAQHDMWMRLAKNLNDAVKGSNYSVVTAMNFHRSYWQNADFRKALLDFANVVDFVGPDSYDTNLENQKNWIVSAAEASENKKVGWMPEAGGNADNKTGLAAEAIAAGGTVSYWQLNNSLCDGQNFSFYGNTKDGYPLYLDWKLGTTPEMPVSSQKMASFNTALNKMGSLIAKSEKNYIAVFNSGIETTKKTTPATKYASDKTIGENTISFTTDNGSVGLAIADPANGQMYLATDSLKDSQTFNVGKDVIASVGSLDDKGVWHETGSREVSKSGDILVKPGELVRAGAPMAVDKTALGNLLGEATQMEEPAYTVDSWKPFIQSMDAAQTTYQNDEATQEDVDAAYATLKDAMDKLVERKASGLQVSVPPTKTEYSLGQQLDTAGMEILVTNNDGTTTTLTSGYKISGYDASKEGKQTVTVTYSGLDATFDVTVIRPLDISGLQAVVDEANELNLQESEYTSSSWKGYREALTAAQQLLESAQKDSSKVKQQQVNDAQVALFTAAVRLTSSAAGGSDNTSGGSGSTGGGSDAGESGSPQDPKPNAGRDDEASASSQTSDPSASGQVSLATTGMDYIPIIVTVALLILCGSTLVMYRRRAGK